MKSLYICLHEGSIPNELHLGVLEHYLKGVALTQANSGSHLRDLNASDRAASGDLQSNASKWGGDT